ncbi:MAG: dihydroneopterin aldolase [Ignavibacteriales bacterium]|nr:dihydroneopterin aldolase [Ignavibacteriales bacterium]
MQNLDIIRINNASFYAYHGVEQDEQNLGGKFEVDVELGCDISEAESNDSLKKTVDYEKVYALLHRVVTEKKYFLIESLANHIAANILETFLQVRSVVVKIRKPHPPVKGVVDFVEVEIKRMR